MLRRTMVFLFALTIAITAAGTSGIRAQDGGVDTSGEYIAAIDFDVTTDSFGFPNYTNDEGPTNLTPYEMERKFGDVVCAYKDGDECILTPPAEQWMSWVNDVMNVGHCEGMAVLALLLDTGVAPEVVPDLAGTPVIELEFSEEIQREIAYWWAFQVLPTYQDHVNERASQTPNEVLEALVESFNNYTPETGYTLIVRQPDGSGGHAISPWAVEDRGDGIYWILVYDNNWPGVNRAVEVDTNSNSWSYELSTNPNEPESLYQGDATTSSLVLAPLSLRLEPAYCYFCDEAPVMSNAIPASQTPKMRFNQLLLQGKGDLQITDEQGRRLGLFDGKIVNEIPGASVTYTFGQGVQPWKSDQEPLYNIPTDIAFQVVIDGSRLKEATKTELLMIGPGYYLGVEEINLEPGQQDSVTFTKDGKALSYQTQSSESPIIILGFEGEGAKADYGFALAGVDLQQGTINVAFDFENGWLAMSTEGSAAPAVFGLAMQRTDDKSAQAFATGDEGVTLAPEDMVFIEYAKWTQAGTPVTIQVDRGTDGTVDEELTVQSVK